MAESAPSVYCLKQTVKQLRQGGVIAYPTEAVWGLGCDPWNEAAVNKLLKLKRRPRAKGLILVADEMQRFNGILERLTDLQHRQLAASWPGPVTWLVPNAGFYPAWIVGAHQAVAIRVSAHPVVRALCRLWQGALVSTSANRAGEPPARSRRAVAHCFGYHLAATVPGSLGTLPGPTPIIDLLSARVVRGG